MKTGRTQTLPLWPELEPVKPEPMVHLLAADSIIGIFRSEAHNYFGHYGRAPGGAPMISEPRAQVVAGEGIVGDRFFRYKKGYGGQVTFFAVEAWERLRAELGPLERGPEVFRRNVIMRGVDLQALIGQHFEVQGVRFYGVAHCTPCAWMNHAYAPGALSKLTAWAAGGLRAKVLTDGWLTASPGKDVSCSAS